MPSLFSTSRDRARLDVGALLLAPLGIGVVLLSQLVMGVPIMALLQGQAALVVVGGTLGALFISYSPRVVLQATRAAASTFVRRGDDMHTLGATMIGLATKAHRRGLFTVEAELDLVADPLLREGLRYAIDETSPDALRSLLAAESTVAGAGEETPPAVFEAAAGYAPTLGILGAVLGLIDVMRHLSAPGGIGGGIAVAFVATVYGVGLANLVLLPIAHRLRERAAYAGRRRELIVHGICAIQQRVHPRALAHTMRAYGVGVVGVAEPRATALVAEPDSRILA